MDEDYIKRCSELKVLTQKEMVDIIENKKYAFHKKYPILINEDGTQIIDIRDRVIIPILNDKSSKGRTKIRIQGFHGRKFISIIVYEAWYDDVVEYGYEIHHKDCNRMNNHYKNLEKLTSENHKKLHGLL
jgi:hypothetical protein